MQTFNNLPGMDLAGETLRGGFCVDAISNPNPGFYIMEGYKTLKIVPGDRFGKLTIVKEDGRFTQPSGQGQRAFLCRCDCGNLKRIRLSHLVHNRVRSCGCLRGVQHNDSYSSLYRVWTAMKQRCNLKSYINYNSYGERGITVCDEWMNSYLKFKKWALSNGYKWGLLIDRINNDGNYSPDNCRFVTTLESACNKQDTIYVNYDGERIPLVLLLHKKELKNHYAAIISRIYRGWDGQKAIDTPIRKGNYGKK